MSLTCPLRTFTSDGCDFPMQLIHKSQLCLFWTKGRFCKTEEKCKECPDPLLQAKLKQQNIFEPKSKAKRSHFSQVLVFGFVFWLIVFLATFLGIFLFQLYETQPLVSLFNPRRNTFPAQLNPDCYLGTATYRVGSCVSSCWESYSLPIFGKKMEASQHTHSHFPGL